MTFKIDAKCGMRGFFTFRNAQNIVVTRPAQIVAEWSAELANVLVALDGMNDTGINDGPLFRWEVSRPVVEYKTLDSFSYKNEYAPIPKVVELPAPTGVPVDPVVAPVATTLTPSVPVTPTTVDSTVDAIMGPGATVSSA